MSIDYCLSDCVCNMCFQKDGKQGCDVPEDAVSVCGSLLQAVVVISSYCCVSRVTLHCHDCKCVRDVTLL